MQYLSVEQVLKLTVTLALSEDLVFAEQWGFKAGS